MTFDDYLNWVRSCYDVQEVKEQSEPSDPEYVKHTKERFINSILNLPEHWQHTAIEGWPPIDRWSLEKRLKNKLKKLKQ